MYTAIIIEFRKHKALSYVLTNFLENLSTEWNFVIFHGNLNGEFINVIIDTELKTHKERITMVHVHYDNLLPHEYSKLLINETIIYDNIPTETFLIFQTDTIIIKKNKDFINDFLKYDYVGAPWSPQPNDVGNGGLSLRKKSKMLEVIDKDHIGRRHFAEDVFFAKTETVSLYKPEPFEASRFSIENYIGCGNPFGCHKPWIHLMDFCNEHPEIVELMALQN